MLAKGCAKFSEILNKASKNYPRSFDFSQSGEIPSILVTLDAADFWSEILGKRGFYNFHFLKSREKNSTGKREKENAAKRKGGKRSKNV